METPYILILVSLLLSLIFASGKEEKIKHKIGRRKLFSIVSIILLLVLGLCVFFILNVNCRADFFNPLLLFVAPIFIGFVIWGPIYLIKHKLPYGLIIIVFDVFIFILAFFLQEGPTCGT